MRFIRETNRNSSRLDRTSSSPPRSNVMVNNYISDSPEQLNRCKSVLFTRTSSGFLSTASTESKQKENENDLPSPRSDVSKGSNRRQQKAPQDDPDQTVKDKSIRRESLTSDMDDNVSVRSGWQIFSETIKNIDDKTDYYSNIQKPNFKSSDVFQKVMVDLYGNPEYGQKIGYTHLRGKVGNISSMTSRMMARRRAKKHEAAAKAHEEEYMEVEVRPPPSKTTVDNAKRGWVILRRHVQERITERKCNESNLRWTMLNQTLRAMSNTERTRMDLYQRYGLVPKLNKDGHFVRENSMLSEKARALIRMKEMQAEANNQKPKLPIRARSSFLPRCMSKNSHGQRQSPLYSRQRTVSFGHKST